MNPYFQRPAVCNTGPLIGLGRIGLADLPLRLFPGVIVPTQVSDELLVPESPDREALRRMLDRAEVRALAAPPDALLAAELDAGEAAVISMALEADTRSVIIDERKARRIASSIFGLEVRGSAGLLVEAKRRGLIPAVKPCLQGMIDAGYFLGPTLVEAALKAANEF